MRGESISLLDDWCGLGVRGNCVIPPMDLWRVGEDKIY